MKTESRSLRMQARHGNNARHAGEFNQHLGHALLGGRLSDPLNNQCGGDILNEELGFAVDVKAAGNNNSFRLSVDQKSRHRNMIPFPLDRFVYCLCSYRSAKRFKKGVRKPRGVKSQKFSALDRLITRREQFEFLAEKVDEVYLFDIEVIDSLEWHLGVKKGATPGKEDELTLRLWRKDIRSFQNGSFRDHLREIGLNPRTWSLGRYEMRISFMIGEHLYTSEFTLYSVLRKAFSEKLARARGFGVTSPTLLPVVESA